MAKVYARSLVTNAILTKMRADLDRGVGDGMAPVDPESAVLPYHVLHPLPAGAIRSSMAQVAEGAVLTYQVTTVGATREQCEAAADLMRKKLTGATLTIPAETTGADTMYVVAKPYPVGSPSGARPEGTIWNATDDFSVEVSSAA